MREVCKTHHKTHTEEELTVSVYKPYEETCNEEKVTEEMGEFSLPVKLIKNLKNI